MSFSIGNLNFGRSEPPLVISEIGINHGGKLSDAMLLAEAAVSAGGHLIKHQTHIPELEMSIEAEKVKPGNSDKSIFAVIKENSLTLDEEATLKSFVEDLGALYFSTPFSFEAVDFLESLDVDLFKIGSGECNNYPLVEYVASKGKPVILSTGMNDIPAVRKSVSILRSEQVPFVLMHTTNLYPTPHQLLRLGGINELLEAFPDAIVGLSDHSTSNSACVAAVALGATVLERHFTDTKSRPGPDIACSMDPLELSALLKASNEVFLARGGGKANISEEDVTRNFAFASVVASTDIQAGELLGRHNLTLMRPHGGDFGPEDFEELFGREAACFIARRTQVHANQVKIPQRNGS